MCPLPKLNRVTFRQRTAEVDDRQACLGYILPTKFGQHAGIAGGRLPQTIEDLAS